jgi:hypothetical protein
MDLLNGTVTESDFENLSWHDCTIWGLALRIGDPTEDDWTSDLVLDIDFIAEWVRGEACDRPGEGACTLQFRVAPATLTFHGVTDLRVQLQSPSSGFQLVPPLISIHAIKRERVQNQRVHLDRPYYSWTIDLHKSMTGGAISFGAVGFVQVLRAEPLLSKNQNLTLRERRAIGVPA